MTANAPSRKQEGEVSSELAADPQADRARRDGVDIEAVNGALPALRTARNLSSLVKCVIDKKLGRKTRPLEASRKAGCCIGTEPTKRLSRVEIVCWICHDDRISFIKGNIQDLAAYVCSGRTGVRDYSLYVRFAACHFPFITSLRGELEPRSDGQAGPSHG